jgi:hypothetical protein
MRVPRWPWRTMRCKARYLRGLYGLVIGRDCKAQRLHQHQADVLTQPCGLLQRRTIASEHARAGDAHARVACSSDSCFHLAFGAAVENARLGICTHRADNA